MAGEVTPGTWNNQRVAMGAVGTGTSRQVASSTSPVGRRNPRGFELEVYLINGVADGESWISNIPNIGAVAWQPDVAGTDEVGPTLVNAVTGEIQFQVAALNPDGWVWVLRGK